MPRRGPSALDRIVTTSADTIAVGDNLATAFDFTAATQTTVNAAERETLSLFKQLDVRL